MNRGTMDSLLPHPSHLLKQAPTRRFFDMMISSL